MVTTLENGDKMFSEFSGTSQTHSQDGSRESTDEGTEVWTGGTGKYKGVMDFNGTMASLTWTKIQTGDGQTPNTGSRIG